MKIKRFRITVGRKGDEFKAWCEQVPGVYTLGRDREDTLKRLKIAIYRKLKLWTWRDSDGGAGGGAPTPHPVPPSPRSPIIFEESHEKPDA
jgi:hypothetical protein